MGKKIAAGNWKMNMTKDQARSLVMGLRQGDWPTDVNMVLAPPLTHLCWLKDWLENDPRIRIAAQNCYAQDFGAFTGEVSAPMLKEAGADLVILGHSERRELFGETDDLINRKIVHALEHGLEVIFCLGEKLEERDKGIAMDVVRAQLESGLHGLDNQQIANMVIAYEPVWAIGTGRTASPEQAQEIHQFIRELVHSQWGASSAANLSILYGGSVNPANARSLFDEKDIDGGLVGGASLKVNDFLSIANSF